MRTIGMPALMPRIVWVTVLGLLLAASMTGTLPAVWAQDEHLPAPENITAHALTGSKVEVNWDPVDNTVNYQIRLRYDDTDDHTIVVEGYRRYRAVVTGLHPGREYEVTVHANSDGVYTQNVQGLAGDGGKVTTYENDKLTLTPTDEQRIVVTWDTFSEHPYEVSYRVKGTDAWNTELPTWETEWTLWGVGTEDLYEVRVQSILSVDDEDDFTFGDEDPRWAATRSRPPPEPLPTPDGVLSVVPGDGLIRVRNDYGNAPNDAKADIRYRVAGTETWTVAVGVTRPEHVLTGLANCTSYEVQARDEPSEGSLVYLPSDWSAMQTVYVAAAHIRDAVGNDPTVFIVEDHFTLVDFDYGNANSEGPC